MLLLLLWLAFGPAAESTAVSAADLALLVAALDY